MQTEIKRSDTGIYTAEGNVAGDRAGRLAQERVEQAKDFENRKRAIEESNQRITVSRIDDKFNRHIAHEEADFKVSSTPIE